ncbi:toll/interleukin-1 receptor domain-containing protein [Enterococcus sp. DIV1420a]|uniref:toll/interleukin-1 receptor domain-containing protein n=1 Tax=Enterococcus sp. DIV1420a TaxID=2774672 RepID=UPI003F248E0D
MITSGTLKLEEIKKGNTIQDKIDKYFLKTYDKSEQGGQRMKKTVFISHISEEATLAKMLKDEIEKKFMGFVEVFVSSDGSSIETGKMWLEQITNALNNADAMIALCSEESVKRPWVNFEMGAGWKKGISVIPACHTNMTVSKLPSPINSLQAVSISNKYGLDKIFEVLANCLGGDKDNPILKDNDSLLLAINRFEQRNSIDDNILMQVDRLFSKMPDIKNLFLEGGKGGVYSFSMSDYDYNSNKDLFSELFELKVAEIVVNKKSGIGIQHEGFQLMCRVKLMKRHERWLELYQTNNNF